MKKIFFTLFLLINVSFLFSQEKIMVDGIIAVVGKEIIMKSDLEKEFIDYTIHYPAETNYEEILCSILERKVAEKLMIHQAMLDSIMVTDNDVDNEINMRMAMLIQQVGGDQKVIEDYYKKPMSEIKKDLKETVRDQLFVQQVQQSISKDITITPSEVKSFCQRNPYDSMPTIETSYEYGHIVRIPPVNESEIAAIKDRLNEYRERVLRGEKFSMLARLYSDDPGTASKGGNLGFVERGTLYPEFEAVAFGLKSGEISQVVKTKAGYHIIQMIERRGESINVAHILLQPKPSTDEQVNAIEYLDSIRKVIIDNKIDFSEAAKLYSDDPNKIAGGWVVNPYTNSYKFEKNMLDATTLLTIDKLIPGEYSTSVPYVNEDGMMAYRIIYLRSKIASHQPNLVEDYDVIKNAALEEKKYNSLDKWIKNKVKVTSIKIVDKYRNCSFIDNWQIP